MQDIVCDGIDGTVAVSVNLSVENRGRGVLVQIMIVGTSVGSLEESKT